MNQFIEMTFDEWFDTYKPIVNHLDEHASFGGDKSGSGTMFETYGDEVAFVKEQNADCIWTYGDGDDGGSYIWNGWHFVNRIGYFITEVPCPPDTDIQIMVSEQDYFCDNCHEEWYGETAGLIKETIAEIDKCPACATMEELQEYEYNEESINA